MTILKEFCCLFCNLQLNSIFIKCEECAHCPTQTTTISPTGQHRDTRLVLICLDCFANGYESHTHKNCHAYRVINLAHVRTFNNWTLVDELELLGRLDTLNENLYFRRSSGAANDTDTSYLSIGQFGHDECVRHVEDWSQLFKNITNSSEPSQIDEARLFKNRVKTTLVQCKEVSGNETSSLVSFNNNQSKNAAFNLSLIRPLVHSKQYRLMSGYRPARGDFETELSERFESKFIADLDYEAAVEMPGGSWETQSDECDELSFDEMGSIETSLKVEILRSYNDVIRERYERKRLIKKLGLLNELSQHEYAVTLLINKAQSTSAHASQKRSIGSSLKNENLSLVQNNHGHLEKFDAASAFLASLPSKFQRLFNSLDSYLKCVELFNYQAHLRKKLADLKEYRANGLRSLRHVSQYKYLKQKRLNRTPSVHLGSLLTVINRFDDESSAYYCKSLCQEWFKKFVLSDKNFKPMSVAQSPVVAASAEADLVLTTVASSPPVAVSASASSYPASHLKYKNNPLKIENYPDCDKLNEEEKEFCRIARVQPTVYLRVKSILVMENKKAGFCSYARARKIAGIDVNKTRLIHNLMLKLDYVKANPPKDD